MLGSGESLSGSGNLSDFFSFAMGVEIKFTHSCFKSIKFLNDFSFPFVQITTGA